MQINQDLSKYPLISCVFLHHIQAAINGSRLAHHRVAVLGRGSEQFSWLVRLKPKWIQWWFEWSCHCQTDFFFPILSAVYPHHVPTMFYADQTNKHGGILRSWWGCTGDNKLDNDLTRMISGFTALRNRDPSGNKSGSKQIGIKVFYCGWFKHPGIKCFLCSF